MLSPSSSPIEHLRDEIKQSARYLFTRTNCIITVEPEEATIKCNRFSVKYPYANIFVKIEICYNSRDLKLPPDLYFIEHDDFMADLSQIKALEHWDPNDAKCLYSVLYDIVNFQFKCYNQTKLLKFSKRSVIEEYTELNEAHKDNSLQIYVNKGLDYVSIHLLVNLNKLVLSDQRSGDASSTKVFNIAINFVHYRDKQQLNLNQDFSSDFKEYIQKMLNSKVESIIHLPEYDEHHGSMKKHVEKVYEAVAHFMKYSKKNFLKRKTYILQFKDEFKSCLVEYDSRFFEHATALVSHEDFYCLFKVKLSEKYPDEAPLLTFYSIYHANSIQRPYKQIVEYSYKPTLTPIEALAKLKAELLPMLMRFKEASIKEGKLNI